MWNMVIGDYFRSFTWGNIKERIKNDFATVFGALSWIFVMNVGVFEGRDEQILFFCVALPLWVGGFNTRCCTLSLPKIMYLCPMSVASRKEYLQKLRLLRMGISVIVSVLSGILYVSMGGYVVYAVAIVWNQCVLHYALACDTNEFGWGRLEVNGTKSVDMDSQRGLMELFVHIAVYMMAFIQILVFVVDGNLVLGVVMLGISLLIEMPMIVWFWKRWPEYLEQELFYETTDRIFNRKGLVRK